MPMIAFMNKQNSKASLASRNQRLHFNKNIVLHPLVVENLDRHYFFFIQQHYTYLNIAAMIY